MDYKEEFYQTKVYVSGIHKQSIVDGPALRYALFVQGCHHACKGCHNKSTWSFDSGGYHMSVNENLDEILSDPVIDGVTLTGGEPFCQCTSLAMIASFLQQNSKLNIWTYTGFLYEELVLNEQAKKLVLASDIIVDGKFEEDKRDISLLFRGSSNQRIIDVKKSIEADKVIEIDDNCLF